MRPHTREDDLAALLPRLAVAPTPTRDIVSELLEYATPRLQVSPASQEIVGRLVGMEAWIELGFWLINWELPEWSVHRLSRDETRWCCSINVRGLAVNWFDDFAEFQHENLALVLFGALVQAQLSKMRGNGPSNVTAFRRPTPSKTPDRTSM